MAPHSATLEPDLQQNTCFEHKYNSISLIVCTTLVCKSTCTENILYMCTLRRYGSLVVEVPDSDD